jgi:hypothetical protein
LKKLRNSTFRRYSDEREDKTPLHPCFYYHLGGVLEGHFIPLVDRFRYNSGTWCRLHRWYQNCIVGPQTLLSIWYMRSKNRWICKNSSILFSAFSALGKAIFSFSKVRHWCRKFDNVLPSSKSFCTSKLFYVLFGSWITHFFGPKSVSLKVLKIELCYDSVEFLAPITHFFGQKVCYSSVE